MVDPTYYISIFSFVCQDVLAKFLIKVERDFLHP